ncbi:hypothetical protein GCM10023206_26340 [Acinetobacter puyangensis]|uniref:Uncharacterized protein n=1 Tax=Acinetobacter puyangensis TaxID=1096779 RepID=A0A240E4B2_9GAMM|nr:hypothetical protein [Acinetobacter puyangensis]SNX43597.1 hypothetical protein SAMN05421731_101639 [Acinetobacter puyangensis]
MSVVEMIYQHSLHLSEEEAKQALAFILFLEQRSMNHEQTQKVVSDLKEKLEIDEELLHQHEIEQDFWLATGIWQDRDIDAHQLRQDAWQR